MTIFGFTGTQYGMTTEQRTVVGMLLADATKFHHGDCVGADAQAHELAHARGVYVISHPPINESKRAFCNADEIREPLEYLDRNREIVHSATELIAAPRGFGNVRHSGTWYTVRYARRRRIPINLVFPNGTLERIV